ncbi:hypothetical protein C8A00DRAFT_36302 [Chaetomidium leptoderma]|uniref:HMG box domain-containing protein n=1 Tax=Chaetomidium leptoderma TaxID=669021 RepID=A0AAN6VH88_9PEZI|nr:hypothetical protein C8A00DRAFT_36302 [Chaetomidium leptoderma]
MSPILFLFFNADLVQHKIDANGGSTAFVGDYTAWVAGLSAEANRAGIQAIIDKALDWERQSGAQFECEKTAIVHFTRNKERCSKRPFLVKGDTVKPKKSCVTSVPYAQTLNEADYYIINSTEMEDDATLQRPVTSKVVSRADVIKLGIRRPRNPFIIYRQWMSPKIHASNPNVTAACISQVVAKTWQLEKPEVKAHFKVLADEEERGCSSQPSASSLEAQLALRPDDG